MLKFCFFFVNIVDLLVIVKNLKEDFVLERFGVRVWDFKKIHLPN